MLLHFNPRSPCGERHGRRLIWEDIQDFNPRSPCGERLVVSSISSQQKKFQSTLPLRGATRRDGIGRRGQRISIHAPLAGSDWLIAVTPDVVRYFNPRSPCGERLISNSYHHVKIRFQSTLPLRGATHWTPVFVVFAFISIHAPLAGSDTVPGGRMRLACISIHAPLAGSDPFSIRPSTREVKFQSTLPLRGAT